MPVETDLQSICDQGQRELVATHYLEAEHILMRAESKAWIARDWDTLSRLYMPLQEARRQRRQRCGEGIIKLDLVTVGDDAVPDARQIVDQYPHGQLLVAAPASVALSLSVRRLAWERSLYVETYLAATYRVGDGRFVVAILPTADVALPPDDGRPLDRLLQTLPPFSVVVTDEQLIRGERRGADETYAQTMAIWERLHAPFLAAASATVNPVQQMVGLRRTIEVDYACELAHQGLSKIAAALKRAARAPSC